MARVIVVCVLLTILLALLNPYIGIACRWMGF